MISDIQSMLNASSGKQSSASQNNTNTILGNTAAIAKLTNEMKLIENLSLIKFQGSESLNFQGKPAQLLFASSAQQPFTLLNTGTPIDIRTIQNAQLNKINAQQVSLSLPVESATNKTATTPANHPLMLASRVVNLTVTSVSPTSNNQGPVTQPQATTTQTYRPQLGANTINTPTLDSAKASATSTESLRPNNTAQFITNTQVSPRTANVTQPHLATVSDGKMEFPIVSQTPLKRGDVVRVIVDANNNMQVLPAKPQTTTNTVQVEALKHSLPKQLSLGNMAQLVKQLHNINESSPTNLPPQTQQALKQLMQSMPTLAGITSSPEAMKQAIQTSGLFSESILANASRTQIPVDLKLNLAKLKDTQENTGALRLAGVPTEHIANAIERITTSQLRHFSDSNQINTPSYPLHIELPIKNGLTPSFVQIEIDKDSAQEQQEKKDRRWLVKLKFDFEETGRFDARASIQANKVGILFAAEDPDTVQKLQKNMSALKQQLQDKDIEVERLDAFQAKLDKEKTNVAKSQSLIDVRT